MHQYKVRVHKLGFLGFVTQADHYDDYTLHSDEPLDVFAKRLAREGFHESDARWIMPGAIMWVERE